MYYIRILKNNGYQIISDLGLCIIKSVPERCRVTVSRGCNPRMTKQQCRLLVGQVSVDLPIKTKVLALISTQCHIQTGELEEAPGPALRLRLARGPHSVSPGQAIFPSTGQLYVNYSETPCRGATSRKKRVTERRRSESSLSNMWSAGREFDMLGLNIERNTQMIKPSCAEVEGGRRKGENEQLALTWGL